MSEPTQLIGAPSVHKWLSEQELALRIEHDAAKLALTEAIKDEIENPPSKDGEDFARQVQIARRNLDDCEDRLERTQKRLLGFEKAVPENRRDTSEQLSRADNERFLQLFAITLREANQQLITGICQEALACRGPQELHQLMASKLAETLRGSVDSAVRESHLPPWVRVALAEVLENS